jgi:hypothetical protein
MINNRDEREKEKECCYYCCLLFQQLKINDQLFVIIIKDTEILFSTFFLEENTNPFLISKTKHHRDSED